MPGAPRVPDLCGGLCGGSGLRRLLQPPPPPRGVGVPDSGGDSHCKYAKTKRNRRGEAVGVPNWGARAVRQMAVQRDCKMLPSPCGILGQECRRAGTRNQQHRDLLAWPRGFARQVASNPLLPTPRSRHLSLIHVLPLLPSSGGKARWRPPRATGCRSLPPEPRRPFRWPLLPPQ